MTAPFKILGINHIGLAPKDEQRTRQFFDHLLGLAELGTELVKEQKTLTYMYRSSQLNAAADSVGEPRLEVLVNETGQEGPIAGFLAKKGGGIHHLALTVDNIDNALTALHAQGVRLIDEKPRKGVHGTRIGFIHPEATGGLLIELVQEDNS